MLFNCSNFCIVICFKSRKMEMSWWSITTDGTQCWIQTFRWGGGGRGVAVIQTPGKRGARSQKLFSGGPPLDPPGVFLAIDPTQRILHVCKWSSLELVIWTQILQLHWYCLDLKKRTVVCRISRPLFITDYTGVMITPGKISLAIYNFAFFPCGWGW